MNKIYRDGVNVKMAIDADANRTSQVLKEEQSIVNHARPGGTGFIKKCARKIASFVYHLFTPVIRPITFKVRRYLIEDLQQEVHHIALQLSQQHLAQQQLSQQFEKISDYLKNQKTEQQLERISSQLVQQLSQQLRQNQQGSDFSCQSRLERIESYACVTAGRSAVNCGAGEILVRTIVGYVLCAEQDYAVVACLLDTGELEKGTRLLIQRFLNPGDVFIDIGAHLGLHTLAAARAMHGQGKIIAFEPFAQTKQFLEKNVALNGFSRMVEIHQAAVSNHTGKQTLFLGNISAHHSLFPLSNEDASSKSVEVPLVRLDTVLTPDQSVTLIKIDAEGAELDVLEGAGSIIQHNSDVALIVEFGPSHLHRLGNSVEKWFGFFSRLGLVYKVINVETGALEEWPIEKLEQIDSANLFFARKGSKAWLKAEQV